MTKRFPAMLLALILCLGLPGPAFAAGEDEHPVPNISIRLPDGLTTEEKTSDYQIRHLIRKTVEESREVSGYSFIYTYDVYSYSEEASAQELTVTPIPLGTSIRIDDPGYANVSVSAWSDPDGDGVYVERIFSWEMDGAACTTSYSLFPLGDGPYDESKTTWDGYALAADAAYCGFLHDGIGYNASLVTSSDAMYERFGPNTIIKITAAPNDSDPEELACFLLTGGAAPPALTVTTVNADKKDMEFTLRNITETFFDNNRYSAIYTEFTRDEEGETVVLKDVATLTTRDAVQIRGIQTVDNAQEPWARVNLSAWSDPDGDGVYDQQLFSCYWAQDSITMVSLSQPGPFAFHEIDYGEGNPIFSRSINVCGTDKLTSRPYSAGEAPSFMALDGNYLTWLFGPDTLVKIQATTTGKSEGGSLSVTESCPYYFYIPEDAVAIPVFDDVPTWFYDAVNWAALTGVTTGTSYHKFSPGKDCTQAQILTFLWRAEREPSADTPCPVTLPASLSYAANALAWAAEKGMVDGSLDPKAPCTRAQAVSYIWQAFESPKAEGGSFTDLSADADYAAAVAWAVENGVTNGFDNGDGTFKFLPGKVCSRGEIAAFLHRACVPEARLTASP